MANGFGSRLDGRPLAEAVSGSRVAAACSVEPTADGVLARAAAVATVTRSLNAHQPNRQRRRRSSIRVALKTQEALPALARVENVERDAARRQGADERGGLRAALMVPFNHGAAKVAREVPSHPIEHVAQIPRRYRQARVVRRDH